MGENEMVATDRLAIVAGLMALEKGLPPAQVLEDVYEAGQQSVEEDPETYGLRGMPC
jgi:hypothetical protein